MTRTVHQPVAAEPRVRWRVFRVHRWTRGAVSRFSLQFSRTQFLSGRVSLRRLRCRMLPSLPVAHEVETTHKQQRPVLISSADLCFYSCSVKCCVCQHSIKALLTYLLISLQKIVHKIRPLSGGTTLEKLVWRNIIEEPQSPRQVLKAWEWECGAAPTGFGFGRGFPSPAD